MLEAVASRIDRAKNPLMRSVSEFELDELADILRRGANPSVGIKVELPLKGLGIGEQLAWYSQRAKQCRPTV
jgi:hypothetical protein